MFFVNISTKGEKQKIWYIPVYRKGFYVISLLLDINLSMKSDHPVKIIFPILKYLPIFNL